MSPELPESLRVALQVVDALDQLGIRYHLGGSYASSIHGIPRQTQDIDFVVDLRLSQAGQLATKLEGDFYVDEQRARQAIERRSSFNLVHVGSGIKVDFFVRGDEPFDLEEFARHRPELLQTEPERRVFVKTPEDTLLRKLQWYRLGGEVSDRQWSDVLGVARIQGDRLDRPYLERWSGELGVADLLQRALGSDRGA